MTYRFASLTKQDIGKEKVEDKESQNRKRSTNMAKELFGDYELNYVQLIGVL